MPTILADHDVEGHLAALLIIWTSDEWRPLWEEVNGAVATFASLGLSRDTPDDELWRYCQSYEFVLLTGNRNADSPTSLEATMRRECRPDCLPVFTIGIPMRVLVDRHYAEAVAFKIIDYLKDIENLRGAQRLFVP